MANILYGVNGEGAGHSTRSREIILHLQGEGHSVIGASFDRGVRNLSDICEVLEIHGFRFTYVNNQVRYNRTLARSLFQARKATRGITDLTRVIDERGIDLVITDYEPLTCRAGRRRKLPVISIDNQHILTHFKLATPPHCRADATAAKLATRMMTPYASHYLVTSFFDAPGRRSNSELVPPILRQQILDAVPTSEGSILVYVTTPAPQLIKLLASVQAEFIAYGFNREGREGNILYKKPSFETFFDDLVARSGDRCQCWILAGHRGIAPRQALPGDAGSQSVRADIQCLLAGPDRVWRLLGGADEGASGIVSLQYSAVSGEAGGVSADLEREAVREAR